MDMVRCPDELGEGMREESDKEIVVEQVVYSFATASMAKAFEACLKTATIRTCKENWQPRAVYPPAQLDPTVFR